MFRAEHRRAAPPAGARATPWHREHEEPDTVIAPAVFTLIAGLVAMWPYTSVIGPGQWSFVVVAVIVATAATGLLMRLALRRRLPWVREGATFVVQLIVAVAVVTQLVAGDTAFFGLFPTSTTVSVFSALAVSAGEQIALGSAPLAATTALAAALGLGFVLVALLIDQLIASRSAVLTTVLVGVIGSVPMIATLGDTNLPWFVAFGILAVVLFRYTARRHPLAPRRSSIPLAAGVAVAALAATVVVAPALPVATGLAGTGVGTTVDASLRLGDDLRQPNPVEVLTVATEDDVAPYLRLTTLSQFNGRVWQPDRGDLNRQSDGFGDAEWNADITTEDQTTSIRVLRMSSSWLPVPYPATRVQGVSGAWRVMPENRTLVSRSADAAGNDYTVTATRVTPTLEQIRAVDAAPAEIDDDARDLPAVIGDLATEVTAEESTDYDRLVALQNWFRSSFTYSLETPVDEGFDGTGADAVARFLDVRSGYCVHFAGAFSLMAQSLDMQTRIVVGYLPGSLTTERRGDESIFSVTSDQLHSWPEVFFPGVGWIPFEPTASLGVPTEFQQATTAGGGGDTGPAEPAPETAPQTEETTGPEIDRNDAGDNSSTSSEVRQLDPAPVVWTVIGVLALLLIPAALRRIEREMRLRRARTGDAAAAWAELRDTLIDLQLPVSDADTPRARGVTLVQQYGVDAEAVRQLVAAVERANYARTDSVDEELAGALRAVLGEMLRRSDRVTQVQALLLPRSLFLVRSRNAAPTG